eukprot:1443948-Pleurochrysis_carterae.AAC.10
MTNEKREAGRGTAPAGSDQVEQQACALPRGAGQRRTLGISCALCTRRERRAAAQRARARRRSCRRRLRRSATRGFSCGHTHADVSMLNGAQHTRCDALGGAVALDRPGPSEPQHALARPGQRRDERMPKFRFGSSLIDLCIVLNRVEQS